MSNSLKIICLQKGDQKKEEDHSDEIKDGINNYVQKKRKSDESPLTKNKMKATNEIAEYKVEDENQNKVRIKNGTKRNHNSDHNPKVEIESKVEAELNIDYLSLSERKPSSDSYTKPRVSLDVDRAGIDEGKIKISMERGMMSKRQCEQRKQLKESRTTTTIPRDSTLSFIRRLASSHYRPESLDVDRAGIDEGQIKVSMERGMMSKKQYERIKQLKDLTTTATTNGNT